MYRRVFYFLSLVFTLSFFSSESFLSSSSIQRTSLHSKLSAKHLKSKGMMALSEGSSVSIVKEKFGNLPDGQDVHQFILTNRKSGVVARVMEYGAILLSLEAPDASGKVADLTLGFDTLDDWVKHNSPYFGATIGRFGNRIAHGSFSLDGKTYTLATNNDPGGMPCSLHGGLIGFDKVLWKGEIINSGTVEFSYTSKDGEEGYPGNLDVKVRYSLNESNELTWEATATTDAPTVINMVHHTYWNLSGNPTCTILDHLIQLNAPQYVPTNKGLIPTGEIASVSGTPMDFTASHAMGKRIDDDYEALKLANGYDHCWVLSKEQEEEKGDDKTPAVVAAAHVEDPTSGRVLDVFTNQPGVQFYTGNFLDGKVHGKGGVAYPFRSGFALETENFPDAPNQSNFPSSVLRPGEEYKHILVFKFSTT